MPLVPVGPPSSTKAYRSAGSSFGSQPTSVSTQAFSFGPARPEKLTVRNPTFKSGGALVATNTNALDIIGPSHLGVRAHQPWPGKVPEIDWLRRRGFGQVPAYLASREVTPPHGVAAPLHCSSTSCASATSARSVSSLSNETMRMTEHPLSWMQLRRGARTTSGMSSSCTTSQHASPRVSMDRPTTARSGRPYCATYGVMADMVPTPRLAVPRPAAIPMLRGAQFSAGDIDTVMDDLMGISPDNARIPISAQRPMWRGSARPFPQTALRIARHR